MVSSKFSSSSSILTGRQGELKSPRTNRWCNGIRARGMFLGGTVAVSGNKTDGVCDQRSDAENVGLLRVETAKIPSSTRPLTTAGQ